jgi:hypothetical protein
VRSHAKLIVIVASVVVVAIVLFVLSSEWYHQSELEEHRQYLNQLLSRSPTVAQVESELGEEPLKVVGPADAAAVSRIWTDRRNSPTEIESKVGQWPETRIYRKSPMVYFIYFDAKGVMRDFSCLIS